MGDGLRVLVCGGGGFVDARLLNATLDRVASERGIARVISGGARGADALAVLWAQMRGVPFSEFHADWQTHGRAAGPIRNRRMLEEGAPDLVIAFPGGRGTADMV